MTWAPHEAPSKRRLPRPARGSPRPVRCGSRGRRRRRGNPPPPRAAPAAWPGPHHSQPPCQAPPQHTPGKALSNGGEGGGPGGGGGRRGRAGGARGSPPPRRASPPLAPLLLTSHCGALQQKVGSKPCLVWSNQRAELPPVVDWLLLGSLYPIGRLL